MSSYDNSLLPKGLKYYRRKCYTIKLITPIRQKFKLIIKLVVWSMWWYLKVSLAGCVWEANCSITRPLPSMPFWSHIHMESSYLHWIVLHIYTETVYSTRLHAVLTVACLTWKQTIQYARQCWHILDLKEEKGSSGPIH